MMAQKMLEVDANLQKIGTDMITMFKVVKKKNKKNPRKLAKPRLLSGR